jgi:diguanylate cyclase (GGDEF)-like protein
LQWVFETRFGLSRFNLLEVNSSENRMISVIDLCNLNESHLDVFFNCDLCRAKRVAESLNSENNPQLCPYFGIDHESEVRCCMPMVMGGRVGAVFTFVTSRAAWKTVKANLGIMKKYLDETAPTLSSLRLLQISKEQALRDPLTQCHNRRFMDEDLGKLEGLHQRNQRKLGFIMADLDHFKMVNDEFGHLAGDEILKQLAVILRQNIRKSDLLVRYGGEEFLIILMEITQDDVTIQMAEKLRMMVEETKLALPSGGTIKKTISMGVAEFPNDADQFYKVIKYADVAL